MKHLFQPGDQRSYTRVVQAADMAAFESGTVHAVYSTFALARDAEWSGRLFVLEMKEEGEEGIGTSISVEHLSPAFEGDVIRFEAYFVGISDKGEIITRYEAFCKDRLIARGEQGQRILPKTRIDKLFESVR